MMRETGRLLLGIQARARFAAYSVFGRKTDCAAEFIKNRDSYILKSPDGALEVTVSGGKLTYSAAVGKTPVIEPSEIGLLVQGGVNLGEDAVLGEPKTDSREEIRRDPDTETDITDRHINYIFPVRSKKFRYSLEVRIWNDGFGFRLLFDKNTGLLVADEPTQFNVPGDTVCRYQTDLENTEWIRPGKSAWSYFIDEEHSRRFEKIVEFNALAEQAGYEYNLADNGWRDWARTERGAFKKVKELVDDAEKRSVGIWLWQSAMDRVWFAPYRRRFFKNCQRLGIKGIKLDHIESETQFMTEFYRRFALEAAEHKLMVIYHNPQKPTGLRRTFPNVMSMEAIRGLQCKADADNDTILPFTRMLGGNADYTPLCFSVPRCLNEVSICHMLASAIIYNSAFFTVSEDPSILKAHGLDSFVSPLPVIWNETHVLPGSKIGELAIFARRSADTWYLAVFNGSQGEKNINLPFSFLSGGKKYEAELYTDDLADQRGFNRVKICVTGADSADIAMRPSGGFAAVFREV